jgi:hypothetical protein
MANDTLTLALNGDVPLAEFSAAMSHFNTLVTSLSSEIAGKEQIEWVVDTLETGSAIATVRGISEQTQLVESVVLAYGVVGKALQNREPIPYSDQVSKSARALTELMNGHITSVRFETQKEDIIVSSHYASAKPMAPASYSFGSLKGSVQTLSRRRGVKFTLYDVLFDRPISCYLKDGQEDMIRDYWGKKVSVTGRIGRDTESGKPFAIRDIVTISPVKSSEPGSYRLARGVLQLAEGETPEGVIRGLRNG